MRSVFVIIILLTFGTTTFAQSNVVSDNVEFGVLKDLWDATSGTSWTTKTNWPTAGNWPSSATYSQFGTWFGVTVTNGDITSIVLNSNNLAGQLPSSIGLLTKLKTLNLNSNHLSGSIPSTICSLTALTALQLSSNQLTGNIPADIGNLTALTNLSLSLNQLSGPIPESVGELVNVAYFYLNDNQLTGAVPESIGDLATATYFYLHNNKLSGTLPDVFANMPNLYYFIVSNNLLTGPLPPTLGSATHLSVFGASKNKFSGSIPASYSSLTALTSFYVDQNQLTGQLPAIGNWTLLRELNIEINTITGSIPSINNLTALLVVKVGKNRLTGAFPSIASTGVFYVDGGDNYFTSLPSTLTSNALLTSVLFGNNDLASVPDFGTYSNRANLVLNLQNNRLDFAKLESLVGKGIKTLTQTPQKTINDISTQTLTSGDSLVLTARPVGTNTTLTWEKQSANGAWSTLTNDQDIVANTYTRTNATQADEGNYRWKTTSTTVTGTIYSDPIAIKTATRFVLDNWAFQYKYDGKKRMIQKKVPGADWVYMVYDDRDRLVMTQDGEQRKSKKWTFTRYDALNRPVITGIYTHTADLDQAGMSALIDTNNFYETFSKTSTFYKYSDITMPAVRFTGTFTPLTVTYYDNYDFLGSDSYFEYKTGRVDGQDTSPFQRLKGQVTGVWTRVLGKDKQWLRTVNYYDDKYRLIQSIIDNHKRGQDVVTNVYDFVGKVTDSKTESIDHHVVWTSPPSTLSAIEDRLICKTSSGSQQVFSSHQIASGNDGWVEFTCSDPTIPSTRTLGFSTSTSATSVGYGVKQTVESNLTTTIQIVVGVNSVGTAKTVVGGDVIRVEKKASKIYYSKNGVLLDSTLLGTTVLYAHAILANLNAELFNPKISIEGPGKSIKRIFKYDHAGRLTDTYHSVDGSPLVLLSKQEYNELGQLIDKKLYNPDSTNFSQSIDYRYNIRGWLTSMNGAELTSNSKNQDDQNERADLFGMDLLYNDQVSGIDNSKLYNGNISAMRWSNNLGLSDDSERSYKFSYDPMSRLTAATQKTFNGTGWTPSSAFAESGVTYDLNGNIKGLNRTDEKGTEMDHLTYNYGSADTESNALQKVSDTGTAQGFADGTSLYNDYTYDNNGNMTVDNNKSITSITYNHLNLPEKVTKSTGDYILYTYDATGRKLAQDVYNTSNVLKKRTDYRGEWFYENDTLKFVNHEEGRVIMTDSLPEYQYHLKDHLGNVRMTFTTSPETDTLLATFEETNSADESTVFNPSYDNAVIVTGAIYNRTPGGNRSQRLTAASSTDIIGLAKSLKVLPGDTVKGTVYSRYLEISDPPSTNVAAQIFSAITSAFGVSPVSTGEGALLYQTLNALNMGNLLLASGSGVDENHPKAYLNYILFDEDYIPYDMGFKQVTNAAATSHEQLTLPALARMPGYVYFYLSNENGEVVEVYFDDFKVEHIKSPVIESQSYYPFGLTFDHYQRENSNRNNYLYNQGAGKKKFQTERIFDLDLNVDQSKYRTYDYITGRWWQVDPKSEEAGQESWSTYHYSFNNPILNNDPEGDCGPCILVLGAIAEVAAEVGIGEGILFATTGTAVAFTTNALVNNGGSTQTTSRSSDTEAPTITINSPTFDKPAKVDAQKKTMADILKEVAEQKAKAEEKAKAAAHKDKQREKAEEKKGTDSQHTKGARPSTRNKHEEGQAKKAAAQKKSNNPNKRKDDKK